MIEQIDEGGNSQQQRLNSADNLSGRMSASAASSRGDDEEESEAEEGRALLFNIKLDRPEPKGTTLSKKNNLCVHI